MYEIVGKQESGKTSLVRKITNHIRIDGGRVLMVREVSPFYSRLKGFDIDTAIRETNPELIMIDSQEDLKLPKEITTDAAIITVKTSDEEFYPQFETWVSEHGILGVAVKDNKIFVTIRKKKNASEKSPEKPSLDTEPTEPFRAHGGRSAVLVKEGATVKAGQTIATIDESTPDNQIASAKASLTFNFLSCGRLLS